MIVSPKVKSSELFQLMLDKLGSFDQSYKNFWINTNAFNLPSCDLWRANCDSYLYSISKQIFPTEVKTLGKQVYLPNWTMLMSQFCEGNALRIKQVLLLAKLFAIKAKD